MEEDWPDPDPMPTTLEHIEKRLDDIEARFNDLDLQVERLKEYMWVALIALAVVIWRIW